MAKETPSLMEQVIGGGGGARVGSREWAATVLARQQQVVTVTGDRDAVVEVTGDTDGFVVTRLSVAPSFLNPELPVTLAGALTLEAPRPPSAPTDLTDPSARARLRVLVDRWTPQDGSIIDPINGPRMVNMAEVTEIVRAVPALLEALSRLDERRIASELAAIEASPGASDFPLHEDHRARIRAWASRARIGAVTMLLDELERLDDLLMTALTIRPCHREDHDALHAGGAICSQQLGGIGVRLIAELGLAREWLPRELHDSDCTICDEDSVYYRTWLETGRMVDKGGAS